jgi:hypothetical protein
MQAMDAVSELGFGPRRAAGGYASVSPVLDLAVAVAVVGTWHS